MLKTRVIPCLLMKNKGLVKTKQFKDPIYVGDAINAVKIFNEKQVDELILLDITVATEQQKPNFKFIADITSECFMPLCYGGGVRTIEDVKTLLAIGVEKVSINTSAVENSSLIQMAAQRFGAQSIVVSIDVKQNMFGKYEVYTHGGTQKTNLDPVDFARRIEDMGAGEILLSSIDRDGTRKGYDVELIKKVTASVSIPVIVNGGAGQLEHFAEAVKRGGASAVAAGSMFVFYQNRDSVLITYPDIKELAHVFN